jgi:hypothetical protein
VHFPASAGHAGLGIGTLMSMQSIFELFRLLVIVNSLQSEEVLSEFLFKLLIDIVDGEVNWGRRRIRREFTLRLVTWMISSRISNLVCRVAISIRLLRNFWKRSASTNIINDKSIF